MVQQLPCQEGETEKLPFNQDLFSVLPQAGRKTTKYQVFVITANHKFLIGMQQGSKYKRIYIQNYY
jgi:hypothetical protein